MRLRLSLVVTVMAAVAAVVQAQAPADGATYVPGEVLVMLKDGPAGGLQAQSWEGAALSRQEAALGRLQAKYGTTRAPAASGRVHLLKTDRSVAALCAETEPGPGGRVRAAELHLPDLPRAERSGFRRPVRPPVDSDDRGLGHLDRQPRHRDCRAGHRRRCQPSGPQGQHLGQQGRDPGQQDRRRRQRLRRRRPRLELRIDDNNDVTPSGSYSVSHHETQVAGVIAAVGNNGTGRRRRQLAVQHHGPAAEPRISRRRKWRRPWTTRPPTAPASST